MPPVISLRNRDAIEELDRLRERLVAGDIDCFYAITDSSEADEVVFMGGTWDWFELIGSLGTVHSMETAQLLEHHLYNPSDDEDIGE